MKIKNIGWLLLVFTTALIVNNHLSFAQSPVIIWMSISSDDLPDDSITMWFGNHKDATIDNCDSLAFPDLGYIIKECFYEPDPRLVCFWKCIPGRFCGWSVTLPFDFRPFPINETRKDTFKLGFYSMNSLTDIKIHWPKSEYLMNVCDSIKCQPTFGELIDMFQSDSLIIPAAGDNGIVSLTIYKWGKVSTGVTPPDQEIPKGYKLDSNYPNPFNPITTFSFAVPHLSHVTITVTNVLGQHVATITDKEYPAGNYTQTWDASNQPSGIYFYKMHVDGKFSETKKLVLLR